MALRAGCPASDDEPFKRFNWHAPYSSFRYFRRRTAVDAAPRAFANGSMVEVTHCGGSKFETNGAFFYASRAARSPNLAVPSRCISSREQRVCS